MLAAPVLAQADAPKGVSIPEIPALDKEFAPGISANEFKGFAKRLKHSGNINE
ncbi:hypothetical protein GCM10010969_02370 [Saccharibacillus kuerlensis]|uniref:Uncharacterized protein n=1 Tax=Saccharibacillus kuerlensis TaxID=459527 RepID=A0ABQ2KSA5_9BACL|nr:hypothetical protein GCM10010969_02370 [Saccharibacillus kuerlensis]